MYRSNILVIARITLLLLYKVLADPPNFTREIRLGSTPRSGVRHLYINLWCVPDPLQFGLRPHAPSSFQCHRSFRQKTKYGSQSAQGCPQVIKRSNHGNRLR